MHEAIKEVTPSMNEAKHILVFFEYYTSLSILRCITMMMIL